MKNSVSQSSTMISSVTAQNQARMTTRLWTMAQWIWWAIFAAVLVMNILAIAPTYQLWQRECVSGDCVDQQLRLFHLRSWLALGFSREAYALIALVANFIPIAIYLLVGLVLFRAKPRERMVFFTSLTLVLFGGVTYAALLPILARGNPLWWYPILLFDFFGSLGIIVFFFVFPNGAFAPPWTRYLIGLFALEEILELFNNPPINWRFLPSFVPDSAFILTVASIVVVQLYRYRRVSNATERRQTKWVVYGTSIALIGFIASALIFVSVPALYENVIAEVGLTLLLALLISAIPLSIAIAMLRARLWDIDLIINRTLVYSVMTAIIAGLLAVLSDLAKGLLLAFTGRASELAPMVATLIIVAVFDPIRKRVQEFMDKHVKYAKGTLGAFGEELGKFVQMNDANALARRFLNEAVTTLDAEGGAIYLGQGTHMRLVSSTAQWNGHAVLAMPMEYAGIHVGMIALSARATGDEYDDSARATMHDMTALVARAILIAQNVKHEPEPVPSQS